MAAATVDTKILAGLGSEVASSFFSTVSQPIVSGSTPDNNGQGGVSDTQKTLSIESDIFPLQEQSFLDLQVYLRAALALPATEDDFKLTYPEKLFSTYMAKDKQTPGLYEFMFTTFTNIHQNCFKFQTGTMNSMMILAGEIANFSWETTRGIDEISTNLGIISQPGADFKDTKVQSAADSLSGVLESLAARAKETRGECKKVFDELSKFKELTTVDRNNLELLTTRTFIVLPDTNTLDGEMRYRADQAYIKLNNLAKQEEWNIFRTEHLSAKRWHYGIDWIGMGIIIVEGITQNQTEMDLAKLTHEYATIFNSASEELRAALMFRERCKHLNGNIKRVHEAIEKATTAINGMMSAFTDLHVGCGSAVTDLDLANGSVSDQLPRRRKTVLQKIEKAKCTWAKVSDLARRFQEHGALAEKKSDELAKTSDPSPCLELVAANYGGVDVTNYAQVLFNYGNCLRIRTCDPGFTNPWMGQKMAISVLSKVENSQRIFICKEFSGSKYIHVLEPKSIADQRFDDAELSIISPLKGPGDIGIKILSIIWGPSEVRSQAVYDYCYSKLNIGSIEWNNTNMGGDTWIGEAKSGVIYYQVNQSGEVKQCTGRENTSTWFTV